MISSFSERHLVGVAVPNEERQPEQGEGSFNYTVPSGKTRPSGRGAQSKL
ncbi:hypothetical protein ACXYMU_04690 [Pontibacter sp. CAU 1760]